MRKLIVTDACPEHVLNGGTRSYSRIKIEFKKMGSQNLATLNLLNFFKFQCPKL
jgi:hypothetical protein